MDDSNPGYLPIASAMMTNEGVDQSSFTDWFITAQRNL